MELTRALIRTYAVATRPMAPVFISYSRADQSQHDWRARLELYLAQARRAGGIEPWDDKRIESGSDWQHAISTALEQAQAAILSISDQNQILNSLSVDVSQAVEHRTGARQPSAYPAADLVGTMKRLVQEMEFSGIAFHSQNRRCRDLVRTVTARLNITEHLEFEHFLFRFHPQMIPAELFEFAQIRAVTDGPMAESNKRMLDLLIEQPVLLDEVPALTALRQHLVFWLNKYERVFRATPAMAVCYVGVEDGVPWPSQAEEDVKGWVRARRPAG